MAATALYAKLAPVDAAGRPGDSFSVSNTNASPTFSISVGGRYMLSIIASTFGTVQLMVLGPDGSTYLQCKDVGGTAISFAANGVLNVDLSAGSYKLALA